MSLSKTLTSKFAKITKAEKNEVKESTLYGTIAKRGDIYYVIFDGSTLLTPVETTADFDDGDRVTVLLKNHVVTVIGNITNPSSGSKAVKLIGDRVSTCESEIKNTPDNVAIQVSELVQKAVENGNFLTETQFQSLFNTSAKDIVGAVEELEGDVSDNTNLINNTNVHRGTTPPANPVAGKTLWVDYSVTPPLLKRYTSSGTWETIGTDKFKTSYIQIQNDSVDIGSGGKVNIKSGAGFSVESGGSVAIKSGGSFTVDAVNLDIDAQGVITAKKAALSEASINGDMFVNGKPVLHAGNIVIDSNAPSNPSIGTVWIKPAASDTVIGTSYSGNRSLNGADGFPTSVYLNGVATSAPYGVCTYTIEVPVMTDYRSTYSYELYLSVKAYPSNNTSTYITFPEVRVDFTQGWYKQTISIDEPWIATSSDITLELIERTVGEGAPLNQTRCSLWDIFPATLSMKRISANTTGWLDATVKYFAG